MAKNQMNRLLQSHDKGVSRVNGSNGVLAGLFRQMLKDLNITPMRWLTLMNDYIGDRRNGVPNNKKDQTSMRGNLTKEFARSAMTWKVFTKALRFFQVTKFEICIKLHHANGRTTMHSMPVNLGSQFEEDEADEALALEDSLAEREDDQEVSNDDTA